jgi:hypothetical protein
MPIKTLLPAPAITNSVTDSDSNASSTNITSSNSSSSNGSNEAQISAGEYVFKRALEQVLRSVNGPVPDLWVSLLEALERTNDSPEELAALLGPLSMGKLGAVLYGSNLVYTAPLRQGLSTGVYSFTLAALSSSECAHEKLLRALDMRERSITSAGTTVSATSFTFHFHSSMMCAVVVHHTTASLSCLYLFSHVYYSGRF